MHINTLLTMTPKQLWNQQMDNLRKQSADRLKVIMLEGKHKRAECAPNRKAKAKLTARKKDYAAMIARVDFKSPMGSFHCPGSMKVYG